MYPELCWALYFERWEKFQLNSNYIKKTCRHCKIFVMSGLELSGLFSEIKKIPWKKKGFYVPISLAATCIWNGRHFSFVLFWIIGFKAVFFFVLLFLYFSINTKVIRMKRSDDYFYTLKITVTFSVLCYLRKLLGQVVSVFIHNLETCYKISFTGKILF